MASTMIGRTACPECGFASAHVKQSEKCTYRYCPECGSQHHARTERQRADLLAKTRKVAAPEATPTPTPTPTPAPTAPKPEGKAKPTPAPTPAPTAPKPEPEATPTPTTPATPKRRGLFA